MSQETDHARFAEFKHQLWLTVSAMERHLRQSYPRVARAGSQYDEDERLAELLPDPIGFYVDVGANAPVDCSNTWQFYRRGWRGLLVECLPSAWHSLLRQRPGDYLCPLAVSDKPGFASLRVAGAVSSVRPDWDVQEASELIVECDTLTNILANYPVIRDQCSLLSIDVEGAELAVLKGIDWSVFKPCVIVLEAFQYHPDGVVEDLSQTWEYLLSDYFMYYQNQLNKIYVRK